MKAVCHSGLSHLCEGEEDACTITGNAFPLDGFSNDGCGLMARLTQGFAELLHTVSIHDDGMPATDVRTSLAHLFTTQTNHSSV